MPISNICVFFRMHGMKIRNILTFLVSTDSKFKRIQFCQIDAANIPTTPLFVGIFSVVLISNLELLPHDCKGAASLKSRVGILFTLSFRQFFLYCSFHFFQDLYNIFLSKFPGFFRHTCKFLINRYCIFLKSVF